MRFEEASASEAAGAVLAHTHALGHGVSFKKGRVLSKADVETLAAHGVARVVVARLEEGDLGEDEAARRVAEAAAGPHVGVAHASTGRANFFAGARGLLIVDASVIDRMNAVDERITIATRQPWSVVPRGEMVATVKIIPFGVPEELVDRVVAEAKGALRIAPFTAKRAGLVLTTVASSRESVLNAASSAQRRRMEFLGGSLAREKRVKHDSGEVARAIEELLADGLDLVLVLGASAVVDRKDVVPSAIERAGGVVEHLGMPVDPGNLLCFGRRGDVPIIGVPGCARSLKPSGFDWILERIAAGVPIASADIVRLGVGGLLDEVDARPSPRRGEEEAAMAVSVAAIVLAAGMAKRMGGENKLLAEIDGAPMVARVVDALLASKASPVLVVTGHQAEAVKAALVGRDVRFVENAAYEEGLGASLRAGIEAASALADPIDGALVALGDMPFLRAEHADRLIASFDPKGPFSICVPIHDRKRGHPVLWSSRHFDEMKKLAGDFGARAIIDRHAESVLAVPIDDSAIHLDVDTLEMLDDARRRGV